MQQSPSRKIAIIGAGAVGSLLGGLLTRAGNDVTLIGRSDHVAAINRSGLCVGGISGEFTVSPDAQTSLDFKPDLVLLAVKMQDFGTTCREIAPFVDNVPVVTLQNGIRGDEIAGRQFGERNIIAGVVFFNAQYLNPGRVVQGSAGVLLVGSAFGANDERAREVADLLGRAMPTVLHDDITRARWTKLLVNVLGNSLDAMTGATMKTCMKNPAMRAIGARLLKEALCVIAKKRIALISFPHLPVAAFELIRVTPLPLASFILGHLWRNIDTTSSALQSLRRRRPTEVDFLNGEIVCLGDALGAPAPFNRKVVEIIHEIEKTGRFYSFADLWEKFRRRRTC